MTTQWLAQDVARDEGTRLEAYPDPLSGGAPWTIGCGHTGPEVHAGLVWTQAQVDAALAADLAKVHDGLDATVEWWRTLSDVRQDVLANMAFNLGVAGLLGFPRTLASIHAGDFAQAGVEMLQSKWAKQVGARANRLAAQMESGERQ